MNWKKYIQFSYTCDGEFAKHQQEEDFARMLLISALKCGVGKKEYIREIENSIKLHCEGRGFSDEKIKQVLLGSRKKIMTIASYMGD